MIRHLRHSRALRVEFECCLLDIEGKQVGPRVSIECENLHGAIALAMEMLAATKAVSLART
jgi:hypothetical protein